LIKIIISFLIEELKKNVVKQKFKLLLNQMDLHVLVKFDHNYSLPLIESFIQNNQELKKNDLFHTLLLCARIGKCARFDESVEPSSPSTR